ncbi:uncharacterized protein LOC135146585 [Zophobas morio]|uniref:uncharacterized protein LOC135146585 n=1 Tax=Zophobas morio TaxID=2755281 RepID=UPI003083C741
MLSRGKGNKSITKSRRFGVLSFLPSLENSELTAFIDFLCRNFHYEKTLTVREVDIESVVPLARQLGLLNIVSDIFKQVRTKLSPFVVKVGVILLRLISDAQWLMTYKKSLLSEKVASSLREIRNRGINTFALLCEISEDLSLEPFIPFIYEAIILPRLPFLLQDNFQHPSGLITATFI